MVTGAGAKGARGPPELALAAAAEVGGAAVEPPAPATAARHADAIGHARHRREVARHQGELAGDAAPQERDHADVGVVTVDPLEAAFRELELVQRRRAAIEPVEIAHPALHPGVQRILEHVPLETLLVLPLAPLAELPAHEQQLLPGMGPHVAEQEPEAPQMLALLPRHVGG